MSSIYAMFQLIICYKISISTESVTQPLTTSTPITRWMIPGDNCQQISPWFNENVADFSQII